MESIIQKAINTVINGKVNKVGRASNLLWIVTEVEQNIQYCFNIQCNWRIVQDNIAVLTANDMYLPCQIAGDNFDCDVLGNSKFDEKVLEINKMLFDKNIIAVNAFEAGDISILLEDDIIIEIFVRDGEEGEMWRFFQHKSSNPHLVVYSNKCGLE